MRAIHILMDALPSSLQGARVSVAGISWARNINSKHANQPVIQQGLAAYTRIASIPLMKPIEAGSRSQFLRMGPQQIWNLFGNSISLADVWRRGEALPTQFLSAASSVFSLLLLVRVRRQRILRWLCRALGMGCFRNREGSRGE